jgi:hypothetical protein
MRLRAIIGAQKEDGRSYYRRGSVLVVLIVMTAAGVFLALYPGMALGQRVTVAQCSTGPLSLSAGASFEDVPDRVELAVANTGHEFLTVELSILRPTGSVLVQGLFIIQPGWIEDVTAEIGVALPVRGVVRILGGAKNFDTVLPTLVRRTQAVDSPFEIRSQANAVLEHCQTF